MNFNNVDPVEILFGGNAEFDAFVAAEVAKDIISNKATEEKLVAEIIALVGKKSELANKKYKNNDNKVVYGDIDDDRDDMPRSYSISRINEVRRNKKLAVMTAEIETLMAELKRVSPESFNIAKMMIEG